MTGEARAPTPSLRVLMIAGVLAAAAVSLLQLDTGSRELADTDGYMRVVRVAELLNGDVGWFESLAPRSNAPYGHSMHWTRPMDAVLIGLAAPLLPFAGTSHAIYWAGVAAGPILQVAVAAAVAWAAIPLLGRWLAPAAGLVAAVQPAVSSYTAAGRADHHGLILLLAVVTVGALIRTQPDGADPAPASLAGVAAGIGLWVSTEFLLVLTLVGIAGGLGWIWRGHREAVVQRRLWGWMAATTALALLIERGPGLGVVSFDRLSIVHLAVTGSAALAWWGLAAAGATGLGRPDLRALAGLAAAAGIGLVVGLPFPDFFRGPFTGVPAGLREVWLDSVRELRPMFDGPLTATSVGRALGLLVVPVVGMAGGLVAFARRERPVAGWWILTGLLASTLMFSLVQVRWVGYPGMLGAIPFVWVFRRPLGRAAALEPPLRTVAVVLLVGVLGFGWRMLASAPPLLAGGGKSAGGSCSVPALAAHLDEQAAPGDVVLATVDVGPELLFRTRVSVVAAPYHRNVEGILDSHRAFAAPDFLALREIVGQRRVAWVAVCPGDDQGDFGGGPAYHALAIGTHPPFLSGSGNVADTGGFAVYAVNR